MGLRAGHEALAKHAARTNGDHALNDVKALAERVSRGVKQGADALLLVVVQNGPANAVSTQLRLKPDDQKNTHQAEHNRRRNQLPAQAGKKYHRQAGAQHQQRRAQIGLLHDESNRNGQQHQRHHKIKRAQLTFAFLKPPGEHERHGNFQDFAGLNHHTKVQPALGALFGDTKNRHCYQQGNTGDVKRHGKHHQSLRRHLRHNKHDGTSNQHIAAMVGKAGAMVVTRGVHDQQAR